MEELLKELLEQLDQIANEHGELMDSEVRERIGVAVMEGFVRNLGVSSFVRNLGMHSDSANDAVYVAIKTYVEQACDLASEARMTGFHQRLEAFQNEDVFTESGNDYEEFFGHTPPEFYDEEANVVRTN